MKPLESPQHKGSGRVSTKVFCVVDNSLKDFVGHHFEYIRSLVPTLEERQVPLLVLAHRDASLGFDRVLPIERIFSRSHYATPCRIRKVAFLANPLIMNYSFLRDLRIALQRRVDAGWLLFSPNVDHMELLGWLWWLRSLPSADRPRVRLFMRWSYFNRPNPDQGGRYIRLAEFALRRLERFPSVRLVTDSQRLAKEYGRLTRLPIDVLPIPHTEAAAESSPVSFHSVGPSGRPRVVFLGGARTEKGFPVLVEAARQLLEAGVELVAQCNLDDPSDKKAAQARRVLEHISSPDIGLIREAMDPPAYYNLLRSADIVVLPYREQFYRSRTSGIFVEALAAGKPVVVTNRTWMAEQLGNGAAGKTFADGDASDLVRAVRAVVAALGEYRSRAEAHQGRWLSLHNPALLAELLLK